MPVIRAHIILLCLAGSFVSIEARYLAFIINNAALSTFKENPAESYNRDKTSAAAARVVRWLQQPPLNEKEKIKKLNRMKNNIGKLIKKKGRNDALRDNERYQIPTVNNFLQKLNNFLNSNSNNKNNGVKRDICSGFGTPGSRNLCKREKNRQFLANWRRKNSRSKYTQHMYEERVRSASDAESGWSDDEDKSDDDNSEDINDVSDDDRARTGKKSRFKIVNNSKSKMKLRDTESSEEMSIEKSKPAYSSDSDNESQKSSVEDSSGEYEKPKRPRYHSESESESDKKSESVESDKGSDEFDDENRTDDEVTDKYMYLQGTRLQKPYVRSQHYRSGRRDPSRMSYFLPKRYNWDPDMLYGLANFWNDGIKASHY